jgi:hypothetical protein
MNKLLNFEEYKACLISYYHHPCDKGKNNERANTIARFYSDDFLKNIITNTQDFISMLIKKMLVEYHTLDNNIFCNIDLPISLYESATHYISNGCTGGWPADELFYTNDDNVEVLISMKLIEHFFGDYFSIYLSERGMEELHEAEQSGIEYSIPTFNISASIDKFDEICTMFDESYNNELLKKEKQKGLLLALNEIKNKRFQ